MKKILIAALLIPVSSNAFATCPSHIVGDYIGHTTKYEGTGPITNVENKVFFIKFFANGKAKIGIKATTSLDETTGVRTDTGSKMNYIYDLSNCTVRMWDVATSSTASDEFFIVGNSGETFYGTAQDVGDSETKFTILTKQ